MCNKLLAFVLGFAMGQVYYFYLLKDISFPYDSGQNVSIVLSLVLGILNVSAIQIRCISLLTIPLYCGKPGRGVLKAIILTYVVAGPISNMVYNATEVVRLFACTTELNYNLSQCVLDSSELSFQNALLSINDSLEKASYTFRPILDIAAPIEREIEGLRELDELHLVVDDLDDVLERPRRSQLIDIALEPKYNDSTSELYTKSYIEKLTYRCERELSNTAMSCVQDMSEAYEKCYRRVSKKYSRYVCRPMDVKYLCNVSRILPTDICDLNKQVDPGIGEGYLSFKKAKHLFLKNYSQVYILARYETTEVLTFIQDARETGRLVIEAFNEKLKIVYTVITIVYICVALLFLRIVSAAITYHDLYLSEIDFDNSYVTGYFKLIDRRRKSLDKYALLPLKKMERLRYSDVKSWRYGTRVRDKLITQTMKLSFDVVTATTFVMLDRLFYEALDVVRLYADMEIDHDQPQDFDVKVLGTGLMAEVIRTIFDGLSNNRAVKHDIMSNKKCLPRARLMPTIFFFKIYGGFLWILFLLVVNPFTIRLRRLICSYFYPRREKHRILHLYNDILKKRMKMEKTLRTKAVQAVRAHYLSAENLISLRMKYPHFLGWLSILPAARMTCLICGETEPHRRNQNESWHSCMLPKCPFVYCGECWREVGSRCIACDPSLAELSDINSLTEDDNWK